MRVALINGSPKGEKSATEVILNFVKEVLPNNLDFVPIYLKSPQIDENIIERLMSCEVVSGIIKWRDFGR